MKKHFLKFALLLAGVGLMLASCDKETSDLSVGRDEESISQERPSYGKTVYESDSYPVSKAVIPRKYDTVYCYNSDLSRTRYRTLKIRNASGTIIQEWLYENLRSDMFESYTWSNDPDGSRYGYFYKWEGDLFDLGPSDWNFMMTDKNESPVTGFHIPNYTDFNNLAQIVGGTNNIPRYLNLTYGSNYYPLFDDDRTTPSTGGAILWVDYHDPTWSSFGNVDPNRVEGCGVFKCWPREITDENRPYVCYTNIEELGCNLRLVRTLTINQW